MKLLDWVPSVLGKPLRYEVLGPPTGAVVSYEDGKVRENEVGKKLP
jgi:hypothetical protein